MLPVLRLRQQEKRRACLFGRPLGIEAEQPAAPLGHFFRRAAAMTGQPGPARGSFGKPEGLMERSGEEACFGIGQSSMWDR